MNLPSPGPAYDARNEAATRSALEQEDARNRKTDQDIELRNERLILRSPDGSRFYLTVANDGTLTTTAVP